MTELKVGQSLTYEQAMALPDGAVWEVYLGGTHCVFEGPVYKIKNKDGSVFCELDQEIHWKDNYYHSARLESLPEQAKPERQASEIAKRAAWALLTDIPVELRRLSGVDCGHVDAANELADACRQYLEAYDYAKSIGAIE